MSEETLSAALDAVVNWPQPPQVHLTGGEPFLHFDLLLHGVREAASRWIACYVETSASWCVDEEETFARFRMLREAGLQAVLISCSPFHAEKIPPVRTLRAIRAVMEVFGGRGLIVYQAEYLNMIQRHDVDRPLPLSHYEQEFGREEAGRILWQGYGIISGGRSGYALGHLVPSFPAHSFENARCANEILHAHHSHFDLYGNYISGFCGGLSIGSWRDLQQVWEDFRSGRYPALIETLITKGPYGLCQYASEEFGYEPLADGYAGKCHLCVDVRRHLVARGEFAELLPRDFYEHI
ncbi:MAG: hypothetical protein P8Z41_00885 [Anaerolineales bacterium]